MSEESWKARWPPSAACRSEHEGIEGTCRLPFLMEDPQKRRLIFKRKRTPPAHPFSRCWANEDFTRRESSGISVERDRHQLLRVPVVPITSQGAWHRHRMVMDGSPQRGSFHGCGESGRNARWSTMRLCTTLALMHAPSRVAWTWLTSS